MNGKKTYLTIAIAALYLLGAYFKFWPADEKIIAGLGFAALAFLRAGVSKGPLTSFALLCALCVMPFAHAEEKGAAGVPPAGLRNSGEDAGSTLPGKLDEKAPDARLFRPNELSLDAGAYARTYDMGTFHQGSIVGGNWFIWRAAGVFAEARTESFAHSIIDNVGGGLIARLPIDKLHLAPQFALGTDFDLESDEFAIFGSVGVEVRFNERVGVVGEIRGYRPNDHQTTRGGKEWLAAVVKLRATF